MKTAGRATSEHHMKKDDEHHHKAKGEKCDLCGGGLDEHPVKVMDMELHSRCAKGLMDAMKKLDASKTSLAGAGLRPHLAEPSSERNHMGFVYKDEFHRATILSDQVRKGLSQNRLCILMVKKEDGERYCAYLREAGLEVEKLIARRDIVIEPIDAVLQVERRDAVTDLIARMIESYQDESQEKGKGGLYVIGECPGNLARLRRYSDCATLEKYWHLSLAIAEVPITVIHLYDSVPRELEGTLREVHGTR